jgi:hypothetical protein
MAYIGKLEAKRLYGIRALVPTRDEKEKAGWHWYSGLPMR